MNQRRKTIHYWPLSVTAVGNRVSQTCATFQAHESDESSARIQVPLRSIATSLFVVGSCHTRNYRHVMLAQQRVWSAVDKFQRHVKTSLYQQVVVAHSETIHGIVTAWIPQQCSSFRTRIRSRDLRK